ncbi:MAG TPA: YHS domain-containing protein, partial [Cyanobacteria bacterium UBA11372]|nr:YHS domain-containing protein [Cyanobacteria bacterium UBA11372]
GFCAWAVSRGYTAPIDPDAWKIVDGKLYLNYNQGVQRSWE